MVASTSLDELEKDVTLARARLAGDLSRLREPGLVAGTKADLVAQASAYKDDIMGQGRDFVGDKTKTLLDDLRAKVEHNPAAALAIVAGVAWRLRRNPPIAALLVGAGLASLLKTSPASPSATPTTDAILSARDAALGARDAALDRIERMSDAARDTGRRIADQTRLVAEQAIDAAADARAQAQDFSAQANAQVTSAAAQTYDYAAQSTRVVRDHALDNPLYVGAAAVALGAAAAFLFTSKSTTS